jgi:putative YhdH/YhfP family quinone oxidoreductase
VESSFDARWKKGDKVLVHGYDLGVAHDGGYAEQVRVPGEWIVRRPESMTAFDAMTLGTAGFTAALAIHLMLHNGLKPSNGPVAVTGATGGVGCVSIEILSKLGFDVVAITGKAAEEGAWLKSIGAKEVLARQSIDLTKIKPLGAATYAGAVDNLGGDLLAWLLSTQKIGGTVASVGLAADMKLATTVAPFILRGVHLLGVDSVNCPMGLRQTLWNKLAVDWRPDRVHDQVRTIDFDDLPTHFDAYLKGMVRGRTVVRIGKDTHP